MIGKVGNSMMDTINGNYNEAVTIVSDLTPLQITPVTDKNATIFVDGTIGGNQFPKVSTQIFFRVD